MKCPQKLGQPNCLLFSLFNIETLSAKRTNPPPFSSSDAGKRDVFLMSLLDMRLMSERHQMNDADCQLSVSRFLEDINSPVISEGDESSSNEDNEEVEEIVIEVTVENNGEQEKDHMKYFWYEGVMIELSKALQSFKK